MHKAGIFKRMERGFLKRIFQGEVDNCRLITMSQGIKSSSSKRSTTALDGWTVSRVLHWATDHNLPLEVVDFITRESIDGSRLSSLKDKDLFVLNLDFHARRTLLSERGKLVEREERVKLAKLSEGLSLSPGKYNSFEEKNRAQRSKPGYAEFQTSSSSSSASRNTRKCYF